MYHLDDTIAAIASAAGGAARGILRISGSRAVDVLGAVFRSSNVESLATVRRASCFDGILALRGCAERDLELPAVLYLWPGTHSYTRQPLGELHTFGSPPLLAAALRTICNRGARLAEPGEFTLRAFLAGRIDLTQAEAVLGVIDAAGRRDLDVALAQLAGGLTGPLQELRHRLLDLLAHLEAGLDFVEEDIEFIAQAELAEQLAAARREVGLLAERMTQRSSTADVPRIVLVGSPNVGKSSLFNRLSAGAGALVADFPGTTRDYVRAVIHVEGTRCELIDTAGVDVSYATGHDDEPFIAAGSQPLRAAAQRLTSNERERADLCLFCLDASRAPNSWERAELTAIRSPSVLLVETKADIAGVPRSAEELPAAAIRTSATTGEGLVDLRRAIGRRLQSLARPEGNMVLLTAERAGASLQAAGNALETAIAAQLAGQGEELIAAEVRGALDELGKVVGAVYTDDILDRVFSRFCIGK